MNVDLKFTEVVSKLETRNITYSDSSLLSELTKWLEEDVKENLKWAPEFLKNSNYLRCSIENFMDDIPTSELTLFLNKNETLEDLYNLEITNMDELVKHYSYLLENLPEIEEVSCCDLAPVNSIYCNTCGKKL